MTIRVVLADDHGVLREGIATLIDAQHDMSVVGQASAGDDAVKLCDRLTPDVAVIDLSMPQGGLGAVRRICGGRTAVRVLVLTMHDEPAYLREALSAGAAGYLAKAAAGSDLIHALREVAAGRSFIRVSLGERSLRSVVRDEQAAGPAGVELSPRERDVLALLARGMTNREVADRLGVHKKTVDTYRVRLQDKLGLASRAELYEYAERTGLLLRRHD